MNNMQAVDKIKLRSGIYIPKIGFGPGIMGYSAKMKKKTSPVVYFMKRVYNKLYLHNMQKRKFIDAIANAFRIGFRLFDYSNAYGNQELITLAIEKSGISRDQLFLTARVSNKAQFNGTVREEFLTNLSKWGVKKVDLLQFHWPVTDKYVDTWKEMIKLKEEGYADVLGVANCHKHHIEALEEATGVIPEINQIEVHPLFTQKSLLDFCKSKDIVVEAYTPVGRYDDRLVRLPLLKKLEQKYNKSFVQIILRWHVQNGVIPVVRALNPIHQRENIDIFDFNLSDEDMAKIDAININSRLRYDPDNCDFTIL